MFASINSGEGTEQIDAESSKSEQGGEQVEKPPRRSVASHTTSPTLGAGHKLQRMYLTLPVSKSEIECALIEVAADECSVSPFNKRIQSLLSGDDPAVQALMTSIRTEGQRDPVLIRPITSPSGNFKYEIIYGSRRRYSVSEINKGLESPIKLKAWISSAIPDIDAQRLAHAENEDRQDISAWEQAVFVRRYLDNNKTRQAAAAEEIGLTQSSISRYLALSTLPESVVGMLESPSVLVIGKGVSLAKTFSKIDPSQQKALIEKLQKDAPYASVQGLVLALSQQIEAMNKGDKASSLKDKKYEVECHGESKIVVTTHRSEEGRFKVDFSGMSPEDIEYILDICRKKWGK